MNRFARLLFAREFPVEEEPQQVFLSAEDQRLSEENPSLFESMAGLLREQERLRRLNVQLQEARAAGTGAGAAKGDKSLDHFIKRLLQRLDGFDRIVDAFREMPPSAEVDNWLRTLEGLYYKIQNDLKFLGLTPLETVGKPVDLNCMEVVDYRPTHEFPHNTVMHEVKRGYIQNGKVLRDAQVVVAYNERG